MPTEQDFDLSAAGLRADGTDLRISVEVLASKLEESLPDASTSSAAAGACSAGARSTCASYGSSSAATATS